MQIKTGHAAANPDATTVVVLGTDGRLDAATAAALPPHLKQALEEGAASAAESFEATPIRVATDRGIDRMVIIRRPDESAQRLCEALLAAAARGHLAGELAIYGPWHDDDQDLDTRADALAAAVEGVCLGAYRFTDYQSRPGSDAPMTATFVTPEDARATTQRLDEAVATATASGNATNWARALVDTPPQDSTPEKLAATIADRLRDAGVGVRIWSVADLERGGFGGILGVGQGSSNAPCLVELALENGSGEAPIVLCGKGVTFDAGGLSIKNDRTQTWMKADMGGAAAVAATMEAAARAGLDVHVRAFLPLVENLPSSSAIRPGDVLRHPDGTTTEVTNTDAEGRLILADALAHANTLGPSVVIDVATLTSGLLGRDTWMLFANDDALATELLAAGDAAREPGWRLPLLDAMARPLRSTIADRKNYNFDYPTVDTLIAARYLHEFGGNAPWAHLDIVGTAFRQAADHWPAGATGSPTRALLHFLQGRAARMTAHVD